VICRYKTFIILWILHTIKKVRKSNGNQFWLCCCLVSINLLTSDTRISLLLPIAQYLSTVTTKSPLLQEEINLCIWYNSHRFSIKTYSDWKGLSWHTIHHWRMGHGPRPGTSVDPSITMNVIYSLHSKDKCLSTASVIQIHNSWWQWSTKEI
jgi:hypothetical protein